jgi:hypothetical protein
MPIPKTRSELIDLLTTSYARLREELEAAGPRAGGLPCIGEWSVKDLLAVRAWWTESVVEWIETGRRGKTPTTPAPGYAWKETPRLNSDLVRKARKQSYRKIRERLELGYARVRAIIDALDDRELLDVGAFEWAGKWPISRWISLNTVRQYTTARTFIRRALREQAGGTVKQ